MDLGFYCYDEKLFAKNKKALSALIKSFFNNKEKIKGSFLKDYQVAIKEIYHNDELNKNVNIIQDNIMNTGLSLSLILRENKIWHRLFAVCLFDGDKRAIVFEIELNAHNKNMQILDKVHEELSKLKWVK